MFIQSTNSVFCRPINSGTLDQWSYPFWVDHSDRHRWDKIDDEYYYPNQYLELNYGSGAEYIAVSRYLGAGGTNVCGPEWGIPSGQSFRLSSPSFPGNSSHINAVAYILAPYQQTMCTTTTPLAIMHAKLSGVWYNIGSGVVTQNYSDATYTSIAASGWPSGMAQPYLIRYDYIAPSSAFADFELAINFNGFQPFYDGDADSIIYGRNIVLYAMYAEVVYGGGGCPFYVGNSGNIPASGIDRAFAFTLKNDTTYFAQNQDSIFCRPVAKGSLDGLAAVPVPTSIRWNHNLVNDEVYYSQGHPQYTPDIISTFRADDAEAWGQRYYSHVPFNQYATTFNNIGNSGIPAFVSLGVSGQSFKLAQPIYNGNSIGYNLTMFISQVYNYPLYYNSGGPPQYIIYQKLNGALSQVASGNIFLDTEYVVASSYNTITGYSHYFDLVQPSSYYADWEMGVGFVNLPHNVNLYAMYGEVLIDPPFCMTLHNGTNFYNRNSNFYLASYTPISGAFPISLQCLPSATGSVNMYTYAVDTKTNQFNCYLKSETASSGHIPFYINTSLDGSGSSWLYNNYCSMLLCNSGSLSKNNFVEMHLRTTTSGEKTKEFFLYLHNPSSGSLYGYTPLYMRSDGVYSGVPMYLGNQRVGVTEFDPEFFTLEDGAYPIEAGFTLHIRNGNAGDVPFYIKVNDVGSGDVPLFIQGGYPLNSSVPMYVSSSDTYTKGVPFYGHGY